MRKAVLLTLPLAIGGCSGGGKYFHDALFWPGYNPNSPKGNSETFRRIRGESFAETPILAQPGNVWPGAPQPFPTLKDVANPDSRFNRALRDPEGSFGGVSLDNFSWGEEHASGVQMRHGQSISAGEKDEIRHGVKQPGPYVGPTLPSSVPDNASKFMGQPNKQTVAIPNGDGTTTLVSPDGSVRVIRGMPTPQMLQGRPSGASSGP